MTGWILIALPVALLAGAMPAAAHSLEHVESKLHAQERFAQFVDRAAADFQLVDLAGRQVSLADLKGKVVVQNFVYARCRDICPVHMVLIARLQSMMAAAGMHEQVRFVTIATDTEDASATRQVMAGYATQYGLDTSNWQFLYRRDDQPAETTMRLAEAYGLKFTPAGEGMQMHGMVTHVIDQTGQLRARFHGHRFEPVHLISYVNALVSDDHSQAGSGR